MNSKYKSDPIWLPCGTHDVARNVLEVVCCYRYIEITSRKIRSKPHPEMNVVSKNKRDSIGLIFDMIIQSMEIVGLVLMKIINLSV